MKKVTFIRHGESEANAGLVTYNDAEIVLSEKGKCQAEELAMTIMQRPDLVVLSSFRRTLLTAAPLLERFGKLPVITIPIHEFTYLSPELCAGTTSYQRSNWVFDYWERNDPGYIHGKGAESFNQFNDRVELCQERLMRLPYQNIIVFTHGHVMRMIWQQLGGRKFIDRFEQMRHFHQEMSLLPVPNGCVFKTEVKDGEMKIVEPQNISSSP